MRTRLVAMAILLLATLAVGVGANPNPAAAEGPQVYVVHLSGANEVPARETDAHGILVLRVSADESEISFNLHATNLEGSFTGAPGAHIHDGAAGQNGPIRAHLTPSCVVNNNSVHCMGTITDPTVVSTVLTLISQNRAYVNVHSTLYPGGEIRGQIR